MRSVRRVLWSLLAAKALLAIFVVAWVLTGSFNETQFRLAYARWPQNSEAVLASRFATWDVAHYLGLSTAGYERGSPSCAFYPLWPAVIRVGSMLVGGDPLVAATVLANVFSILAFWALLRLVARRWGDRIARDSVILMVAFPGALFFSFGYTESLYLLLVVSCLWALEARRYFWVCITAFLLPMARPVGVFMVLPLAWHAWQLLGRPCPGGRPLGGSRSGTRRALESAGPEGGALGPCADAGFGVSQGSRPAPSTLLPWLGLMCPVLGYAAYFGILYLWTGNPLEGFVAQQAYPNAPSIMNMFDLAGLGRAFANIGSIDGMMDSALDRLLFLFVLGLLPCVYRLEKTWFWYVLPAAVVPALTSWFMSYRRYVVVLFPLFIVLARLLGQSNNRWLFWYCVVILAAFQTWAVSQFISFHWAG